MINQARLPWITALTALLLYLCTMGSGMTLNSMPLTIQLAGWSDTPIVGQPLLWLVTLPLHWLPAAWVTPGLKLISAALGAIILGLLVRSVQLLPWDQTWDAKDRFASWLPPLAASGLCGLELAYWREATSTCGELMDLLPLAVALWLVLEYRVRRQLRWLQVATVVWGVGMAENWVMLLTFPLFASGVIWLEALSGQEDFISAMTRLQWFARKMLFQFALLGLAGFSLYLVLPMVNGLLPHSPWTLGESWHASLHQTKNVGRLVFLIFWRSHRVLSMAVVICYLVPILPLLVRLRDGDTYHKSSADRFQMRIYRILRLGLLLVCVWLTFDPTPGARQMIHAQLGGHLPLLSFDYLNALSSAFLLGNLLLITHSVTQESYRARFKQHLRRVTGPVAATGLALVTLGLVARNAPAIGRINFHPLEQFGTTAVACLPPGPGILLGESPEELLVMQAALARQGRLADWTVVNTRALPAKRYREGLERRHPGGWLANTNASLTELEILRLLEPMARTKHLFYLYPDSSSYLFERFYLEPAGSVFAMKLREKDPLNVPPLSGPATETNEQFWTRLWAAELAPLVSPTTRPTKLGAKLARCGIVPVTHDQDRVLAEWYSLPLEGWAVTLQKQGRFHAAHDRFEEVTQLVTNNISARLSLACNTNLESGTAMSLLAVTKLAGELGNPDRMDRLLQAFGPFDNPPFDYLLGCMLLDRGLLLQAAEQLERVRVLVPSSPAPEMNLAEIYNRLQMPDRSQPLIAHLREVEAATSATTKRSLNLTTFDLNLALLDSHAWLLQTNLTNARDSLQAVVKEHPDDPQIINRVLTAYLAINDLTNAMQLIETQLVKMPDNVPLLNAQASILVQTGHATNALPILDHIIALTNTPAAHLARAFAQIAARDLTTAKSELSELVNNPETFGPANYGLAILAKEAADTNTALHYLQICLTNAPLGTPLWRQANGMIQQLRPPPPPN